MTQGREGLEWMSLCKCCSMVAHELIGTCTNILSYTYFLEMFRTLCVCVHLVT